MGPKKEAPKKEPAPSVPGIDDPLNSDTWRCVVVVAVEKSIGDSFVMKEFLEEASIERRQEVKVINFETVVMKILNDFVNGELAFKHVYLLNYSSVFQEAAAHVKNKSDVPLPILVKVLKALMFSLRDKSLQKIEKRTSGPLDPVKAMAERPANPGGVDPKGKANKMDSVGPKGKKTEGEMKVRPPSAGKQDTKLLKRGEAVKEDEYIDDAPLNGYYNLYVLLTGFYDPELPLELIKAGIPLHGLLCIDTSLSETRRTSSERNAFQKPDCEAKSEEIRRFWDNFLEILWNPKFSSYFKDVVFQLYLPRKLVCDKQKLKEFIYREISFLLYDMSDYTRQFLDYRKHLKVWDVEEKAPVKNSDHVLKDVPVPNDHVTPAVVLKYVVDAVAWEEGRCGEELVSLVSEETLEEAPPVSDKYITQSLEVNYAPIATEPEWSEIISDAGDPNLYDLHAKLKQLDEAYNVRELQFHTNGSGDLSDDEETAASNKMVSFCGENLEAALRSRGSALQGLWRNAGHANADLHSRALDHCLYPLLMTRVGCPYRAHPATAKAFATAKKNSVFESIGNLDEEMHKPHFTVTDGSRSILKAIPFNVKDASRDFFCPAEYKVVSPEKVKASSAPEFRTVSKVDASASFVSDFYPLEAPPEGNSKSDANANVFANLRGLLGEDLLSSVRGFSFVEELNKEKLLQKEAEYWDHYNCVDSSHFFLNDSVFVVLHRRKDAGDFHHETFNEILRTRVGLRDFFEYVLDDESEWFRAQEDLYEKASSLARNSLQGDGPRNFTDMDFWLSNSIKYEEYLKLGAKSDTATLKADSDHKKVQGAAAKDQKKKESVPLQDAPESGAASRSEGPFDFEGYDVSDVAVQYSGLRTAYLEDDCSVRVDLVERLYGDQELSVHVSQGGHTLHLPSYVCPRPHVLRPYACHLTYKNGIVVAFGKRSRELPSDVPESKTTFGSKKSSSESSVSIGSPKASPPLERFSLDEEFNYDMKLSYPTGLTVQTVRKTAGPCYLKQEYLARRPNDPERSRLFLPNGHLVKMLEDNTVRVLRPDSSVVTASLLDLVDGPGGPTFRRCDVVTGDGRALVFEEDLQVAAARFQVFQRTEVDTRRTFFHRRDGTEAVLMGDGSLCVRFGDGTRSLSTPFAAEAEDGWPADAGPDDGEAFVFVHTRTVFEHPAYASAVYDSSTLRWEVLLPAESKITIGPQGNYCVAVDARTELQVEGQMIRMRRAFPDGSLRCEATADLGVFEGGGTGGEYCRVENSRGKTFVVEANSRCYMLCASPGDGDGPPEKETSLLSRENKYLMMRRNGTGLEVLHEEDVRRELTDPPRGTLVFVQQIPRAETRCFVLVSPAPKSTLRKWETASVLPDAQAAVGGVLRLTSSTYGDPPSWMHPFPKRKYKFRLPERFKCRVFVETTKTDLNPPAGSVASYFAELEEPPERKHTNIVDFHEYASRLARDDQHLLREMYALSVAEILHEKKKLRPVNPEKLRHYLEMSRYYVEMQEYHKECIRYQIVPNYFRHPAGMAWLILNETVVRAKLPGKPCRKRLRARAAPAADSPSATSGEELEYDLSAATDVSFSELSCRTDVSAETAPAYLETGGVCRCRLRGARDVASAPVELRGEVASNASEETPRGFPQRLCEFREDDFELLEERNNPDEFDPLTLEDLKCLGLV